MSAGVSPLNTPLTPRQDVSLSRQSIEARAEWFKLAEMEKLQVAEQLAAFDESLRLLHQRTPRLNMPWRHHIPLDPPADDYAPAPVEVGSSSKRIHLPPRVAAL